IYTFPHALMILLSALSLADARLFDAASSMGAGPWRAFSSITWPATRQAVFAAFCLVFTLTITDFGVPVVVGGDAVLAVVGGIGAHVYQHTAQPSGHFVLGHGRGENFG
ncbi:ABC transporter permease subunit, partial [Pseudomonas sp. SIMBA_041]|uniref:ABC transporter permease subunit n=1 Tax=Pseudomonas sp. SIMBA_041 TaxID=3085782 RepID=UPI003979741E